jgi:hypothetical protein
MTTAFPSIKEKRAKRQAADEQPVVQEIAVQPVELAVCPCAMN